MTSYVFYDGTGTITKTLRLGNIADTTAAATANTPAGSTALAVPDDSPALMQPADWKVSGGSLVPA